MNATILRVKLLIASLLFTSLNLWAVCENPTGLTVSELGDTKVTLNWDAVNGADQYRLAYRVKKNRKWVAVLKTSETSYLVEGLNTGTPYEWGIRVFCGDNQSKFIFGPEFTTSGPAACGLPENLAATAVSETSLNFNWDDANGSTSYRLIYWKRDGRGNDTDPSPNAQWIETSSSQVTIDNLQSGTTYLWTVRNVCKAVPLQSALTAFNEVTTLGTLRCEDPSNMQATYISSDRMELSCDPAQGSTKYRFAVKETGAEDWIEIINTTENSAQITVDASKQYQWGIRVICENDGTVSRFLDGYNFTSESPCDVPSNLASRTLNNGALRLTWTQPSNASSSQIRYRELGTNSWTFVSSTSNRKDLRDLPANTVFEWQLRTICSGSAQSASVYSETAYFNTSCDTPKRLSFGLGKNNRLTLRWDNVRNVSSYLVQYRVVGQTEWIEETTNRNRLQLNNMPMGITYEWRVKATCSNDSQFSPFSEFSIPDPNAPNMANGKFDLGTGTETTTNNTLQLQLNAYPNPVVDILNVAVNGTQGNAVARILNSAGKLILEQEIPSSGGALDVSTFKTGIYILQVVTQNQMLTDKIVINHSSFR